MKGNFRVLVFITILALAALACNAVSGGGNKPALPNLPLITEEPQETLPPQATEEPQNNVSAGDSLFSDDFSSSRSQWGTGTDPNDSIEYVNDALNFKIFEKNFVVWSTPNSTDYQDVHLEVTVINNGTDSNTAFGFECDMQHPITDSHYYFAVTPAGEYAIAKAVLALDDVFLTNNDKWAKSDLIAKDAASYRLGADCGNGKLTLYVDGQQIASVDDSTYTSGGIGLFVWSAEKATKTDVSFDDFNMTKLP